MRSPLKVNPFKFFNSKNFKVFDRNSCQIALVGSAGIVLLSILSIFQKKVSEQLRMFSSCKHTSLWPSSKALLEF